jgi:cystathionine beta-lyase
LTENECKTDVFRELRRKIIVEKAGLWLDKGEIFGEAGNGFERLNFACPRSVLERALSKLKDGIKDM